MKKRLNAICTLLLVMFLLLGQAAVAQEVNPDAESETKLAQLSAKAKRKFKGTVKAAIKTKGKLRYGDEVTLKATVKDAKKAEYTLQWQTRASKKDDWEDIPGENKVDYTFIITEENAQYEWRVALIAEAFVE